MPIQINPDFESDLKNFFKARAAEGAWKKESARLRLLIEEKWGTFLASAEVLTDADDAMVAKIRHVAGVRLNQARLQAERPDIYAEFTDETVQVRIEGPK